MNNCKKLFKVGKNLSKGVFSLVLFTCGFVSAASVAPFYFDGVDGDKQQDNWEYLMKYKMWGTSGIFLTNEGEVRLEEISGYVGTATGDMTINNNHHIGGPILIGGNLKIQTGVKDVHLLGGPTRVLKDVSLPAWQSTNMPSTRFDGPYCVQGNLTGTGGQYDPTFTDWENKITGGLFQGEDYSSCPASVPEVDTSLFVPKVEGWETAIWEAGINAGPSNQVHYIHVPPDSVYENEYGTFDKYIEEIKVTATPQFKLFVVMPPGGRLTRIFVRDGLNIDNSSHNPLIQVVYVEDGTTFNKVTNAWDMSNTDNFVFIDNQNYAGNLLFFTDKPINWGSTDGPEYQGTFITTDTLSIGNDFTIAGQLVAKYIKIRAPFTGDFRYVPFDPPILNIDPTALASGKFIESDKNQYVPIKLDAVPRTAVYFSYCFEAPDSTGEGVASLADFDTAKVDMPICGIDTGLVNIPVGKLYPTDSVFVNAKKEGLVEIDEKFKLHVFDMGGAVLPGNKRSGSFTLYIKDGDENVPPVFNDTTLSVAENSIQHTVVGTVLAKDANGDDLTYSVIGGDSAVFRVENSGKVIVKKAILDYETKISYKLTVVVFDGLARDTATVTINVLDVNEKPVVSDVSYSVEENTAAGLVLGTLVATDPDKSAPNNTLTYKVLSGNDAGMFELSDAGNLSVAKNTLDFEKVASYTLTVQVSDAGTPSQKDTAIVKISVLDVNEKPVVSDASYSVEENSAAGLVLGTLVATDPDKSAPNNTLTYKVLSGNDAGMFELSDAGKLSVAKNTLDYEKTASYTLTVQVSDAGTPSLKDTAIVKISVLDVNEKPEIADASYSVEENTAAGLVLGTLVATDPDKSAPNNTLTYKVLSGNDAGMFELSTAGKLTLVSDSLDYEKVASYTLTVQVSDAGTPSLKDTAIVKISVLDVNEKPEIADASYSVEENSAAGLVLGTLVATDPDKSAPNNTLTYKVLSGNDAGMFELSDAGKLSVAKNTLDYEKTASYTLTVQVSDAGTPSLKDTAIVKISVLDVNEKPEIADASYSVEENTAAGLVLGTLVATDPDKSAPNNTLTYKVLSGNDAGMFELSTAGKLTLVSDSLDYEKVASYTLTVQVSDAGTPSLKDTAIVKISVLDVNEKPVVSDASYSVEENSAAGLVLGTLVATDPDKSAPNNTLTYKVLSGNDAGMFELSAAGKLSVAKNTLDFEKVASYTLTVQVSDAGTPSQKDTAIVKISVLNVNEKPVVSDASYSVEENTAAGLVLGTLVATDPDKSAPNNTLTYKVLSGNDAGMFELSTAGKLTLISDSLDYEKVASYTLTVQVSDAGTPSLKDTAIVKISVLDVNEKPVVSDASYSVEENNKASITLGTLSATDPDKSSPNNSLTYKILSGNSGSFFEVSATGKLSVVKAGFDYETKSSYTLTVQVSDAGTPSLKDTAVVKVSILNVNEKPVIADAEFTIPRSATAADLVGVLKATDVDAGDQALLSYAVITSGVPFEQKSSSADLVVKGSTPFINVAKDSYVFSVVVTDRGGLKDTAKVVVKIKNSAPEIVTEEMVFDENSKNSVQLEVTDADGDTKLIYAITDPSNKYEIDAVTGIVRPKKNVVLNYESADSVTVVKVTVSDGLNSTTKNVTIKIKDVNESPLIENQTFTIAENSAVKTEIGKVKASDPDKNALKYTVIDGDSDWFALNSTSAMISLNKAELDYEKQKTYSIRVVVSDGSLSDTAWVRIDVTNVKESSVVRVVSVENDITRYEIKNDTAFINRSYANIHWALTNKEGKNSYRDSSLKDLPDGCRLYVFSDTDKTIDVRGRDSVTVCVSTSVPEVVIKPLSKDSSKITGVTIVEEMENPDSLFYVNEKENDLVAIVKDPLTNSTDTIPLQVRLDSVVVPERIFEVAKDIQDNFYPQPNESSIKKTPENGNVVVEYTQKVNGVTVTVKSYETESGEKILDSEGREVVYVTYATVVNGDTIKISYPADALTGKPIEVAVGNKPNSLNGSGSMNGSESSNNSGSSNGSGSSNSSGSSNGLGSSNGSGSSNNSGSSNGSGSSSGNSENNMAGSSSGTLNSFSGGMFEISYIYKDKNGNVVEISYPVDSKGSILENEEGDKSYDVTYSYVNDYGNSATHSVSIILDEVLPVVKILTPEHLSKHSSVSVEVIWTVDGVEQDTLNLQSLDVGTNKIIRTFRDKAGNEASDTVVITMKNAKNVIITMQEPLVKIDPEKAEELYASNPPEEDERFAVSIFNPREEKEELVLSGNSSKVEKERGEEPYPGHSGAHLGPTMKVELKMPSVNAFGGLATIDDMIESDGLVSLEAGGGWDREKITVDEYISDYCSEEFQKEVDKSNLAATPLYTVKYKMHVWIYTSLGNFVDDFSFSLDLTDGNLVNDAGVLELFFEMKPGVDGALRASTGRLLGTGAYLVKTEISSVAKLRCQLPDKKVGSKVIEKENDLTSFGYSRPVHLK